MKRVVLYGAAGVAALVGVYLFASRKPGEPAGVTLGRLAVGTVADAGVGAVKGIGSLFGIPDTSVTQCQRDQAAGDHWAASFSCPAGTFLGGVFGGTTINYAERTDAEIVDRQIDRILERQGYSLPDLGGTYNAATGEQTAYYDAMGNRWF